jgi:hypothetical protein
LGDVRRDPGPDPVRGWRQVAQALRLGADVRDVLDRVDLTPATGAAREVNGFVLFGRALRERE